MAAQARRAAGTRFCRLGTYQAVFGQQDAAHWPAFAGFSPAVVPRPADWRDGLEVTGYWWPMYWRMTLSGAPPQDAAK